jgi:hypothetical protein
VLFLLARPAIAATCARRYARRTLRHPAPLLATLLSFLGPLLLCALFLCPVSGCHDPRSNDVRNAFGTFSGAVDSRQGRTAADMLSKKSADYYVTVRDAAMNETKEELLKRGMIFACEVLELRSVSNDKAIAAMDGRAVFAAIINAGSSSNMTKHALRRVAFESDTKATATVDFDGEEAEMTYDFYLEDGSWRIDFQAPDKLLDKEWRRDARAEGLRGAEALEWMFAVATKRHFDAKLWNPSKP